MRLLDGLRRFSVIVEDTGDIDSIERFAPTDATTNPSLLYQAAQQAQYAHLVGDALRHAQRQSGTLTERAAAFIDRLFINFGTEILRRIPGRVSTEVDAGLSFDLEGTITQARHLIELYEKTGVERERVLIKVASTWEGIRAAELLEAEGIHCNLTLLFSLVQAAACAEAGATLISPFVGRIYDWHKKDRGGADIPPEEDPGVASVVRIYNYLKRHDYRTEVMGASFRKVEQILLLAGCDLLTISPELLEKLETTEGEVPRRLYVENAKTTETGKLRLDEKSFRWMLNQDAMATEKLAEGIRRFFADSRKLEHYAQAELSRPEKAQVSRVL